MQDDAGRAAERNKRKRGGDGAGERERAREGERRGERGKRERGEWRDMGENERETEREEEREGKVPLQDPFSLISDIFHGLEVSIERVLCSLGFVYGSRVVYYKAQRQP